MAFPECLVKMPRRSIKLCLLNSSGFPKHHSVSHYPGAVSTFPLALH